MTLFYCFLKLHKPSERFYRKMAVTKILFILIIVLPIAAVNEKTNLDIGFTGVPLLQKER